MSQVMTNVSGNKNLFAFFGLRIILRWVVSGILFKALFAIFSLAVSLADIKTGMVPRLAFIFAFPLFFALGLLPPAPHPPEESLAGALLGLLVFLLAFFISKKKLGLADVWYSALTGLVLGPLWWYAAMCCACAAGIIYILVSRRRQIPFIPLMAFGSIVMCFIQKIIN